MQKLGYEGYLSWLRPKLYRDIIVRFRLGIINPCYNKYRYSTTVQMHLCPVREVAEENGIHFIFVCQAFNEWRNVYIYQCQCCK